MYRPVDFPSVLNALYFLLMESGFTVPMQRPKVAYLIEKGYPADKLVDVIAKAQEERQAGQTGISCPHEQEQEVPEGKTCSGRL